jgi:hypothetical protein
MTNTYREVADSRFRPELDAHSGELCREQSSE